MKKREIIQIVLAVIILSACGGQKSAKKDVLSGKISIDGSSTVYPITEAVAEEFRVDFPEVLITVGISGSGGGFKKFGRGETDISDASRPIKQSEIELCAENNINYIDLTVAYDGLAVLINPANDWVDHFNVEELRKLWEPDAQGKIMKWSQIRPEWPDDEIHLYGPGVTCSFRVLQLINMVWDSLVLHIMKKTRISLSLLQLTVVRVLCFQILKR